MREVLEEKLSVILQEMGVDKYSDVLGSEVAEDTLVLVSRAMDYIHDHSKKFAIIVMDGMSEFDWKILSRFFGDIKYDASVGLSRDLKLPWLNEVVRL